MTEKELEKLFKSKLDNRQFAFNPANWEAMEAILDNEPKPAGAYYWRSVMAVLLFGLAVWGFITFTPAVAESEVVNRTETIIPVESISNPDKVLTPKSELADGIQQAEPVVESTDTKPVVAEQQNVGYEPAQPVATQSKTSNPVASKPVVKTEEVESVYTEDLEKDEADRVEPSLIVPLSEKGFVFQNELQQSLMEVSPGGQFTPEAFKKFDAKSSFYLEAAPIFSGSYNANNVGVGWKLGLGWERSIGERLQFNVGLGYTVQNGVGIENSSDSVFYNFGKEVIETQEVNNRLDYIELPVSLGYKLNGKNMLSVGMYAGYLINVSREVDKEISKFKTETEYESTTENGYQKEFKRMDYGLELGYRYRLTPALSVGLHYNLGLVDITKNTQGDYLKRHTNHNTRVVFRYRFL